LKKTKLTLYVNKEISKKAKKISDISGKSISNMVSDYFIKKDNKIIKLKISKPVSKWIGVLETTKTYKKLRDEIITDKLKEK